MRPRPITACAASLLAALGAAAPAVPAAADGGREIEFTLLAYNVENAFDLDGVSLFDDYRMADAPDPTARGLYRPAMLWTKVRNIARVLRRFNDGAGPEIVVFNEFELDRTPASHAGDPEAFLRRYAGTTAGAMLAAEPLDPAVAGLPAEAFLLKHLWDLGTRGYHVVKPAVDKAEIDAKTPHTNVVFSKFPVRSVRAHPTELARDILEVELDVGGHRLVVFNNHWKSGASSAERERVRVNNARTLRSRLDALLAEEPRADIVLAGDFNSHYNQLQVLEMEGVSETGINTVLGSQGDELAIRRPGGPDLYNLWFELPHEKRGSETWKGRWGTLMQILLTRGLYDKVGIQYIDNSFAVAAFPGLNAEPQLGRPARWHFAGEAGGGFSDHFPVYARFRTVAAPAAAGGEGGDGSHPYVWIDKPSRGHVPRWNPRVPYERLVTAKAHDAATLAGLGPSALAQRYGEVFKVTGRVAPKERFTVHAAGREFEVYAFDPDLRTRLQSHPPGTALTFYGELGEYRGRVQFLLQHPSWLAP